ncbi:MAG: hypothetical protein P1U84_05095 [Parvibaculaceae bacterium]|nr:hypothetical protein [Parvibaculaceae bacterium]
MIVLALDQSTSATGWALGEPGSTPTCGTFVPPRSNDVDNYYPLASSSRDWLTKMLAENNVTHLRFEQPLMPRAAVKWINKKPVAYVETNIQTLRKLYGLAWEIELVAGDASIDCRETNIATWRSWFIKGITPKPKGTKALKQAVMDRCNDFGWYPKNDNEGDALGIWAHAGFLLTKHVPQRGPGELFGGAS